MGVTRPVEVRHGVRAVLWVWLMGCACASQALVPEAAWLEMLERFEREVDARVEVPQAEQSRYAELLARELGASGVWLGQTQFVVLIDRSPSVQVAAVLLGQSLVSCQGSNAACSLALKPDGVVASRRHSPSYDSSSRLASGLDGGAIKRHLSLDKTLGWRWLGATRTSTGRPGSFEHFLTPLGVFEHNLDNPDFRAEGTYNSLHIRGYGLRGMRVFDLGWVAAERGWGRGGISLMRLQMHATDPDVLEPRLGRAASKGCIRIPASLNSFIDRYGLLDEAYFEALVQGKTMWVLREDREPTPWPGRYVVVVDSQTTERPDWAALPSPQHRDTESR